MHRAINEQMVLYFEKNFPHKANFKSLKRYSAVVGIGGNVGDVRRRFAKLFRQLQLDWRVDLIETGPILKNPPFGFMDQRDFYNSVMLIKTNMAPERFLNYLLQIERRYGRVRSFKNAPRTLDLDIIFFDKMVIESDKLIVPHPHWAERESVLIPLSWISDID